METKYTTDGKKVLVIGNLNSQETIVQEIFISNGVEVPSGEKFVVKSLHDSPVISWKEKQLLELEKTYQLKKDSISREIEKLEKQYREKSLILRNKIEYAGKVMQNLVPESFNTLVDYLTGEINYIVIGGWDLKLLKIEEFKETYDDKLRLLSFYGKDDGTMQFYCHEYYDGSGHNQKPIFLFKNYEDAFEKFKELVLMDTVNDKTIKIAEEYNIQFPQEKIDIYVNNKITEFQKNIVNYSDKISEWKNEINRLVDLLVV